jgi:hypothetical protein
METLECFAGTVIEKFHSEDEGDVTIMPTRTLGTCILNKCPTTQLSFSYVFILKRYYMFRLCCSHHHHMRIGISYIVITTASVDPPFYPTL